MTEDMAPALTEEEIARFEQRGPLAVGNATFTLVDRARADRALVVEVWYPAAEAARAAAGEPVERFVAEGADRELIAPLIAAGPPGCVLKTTQSTRDAAPLDDAARPLILFSHCHGCTRWSMFNVAEQLASHGFIVVAPDHTGNTLADALRDQNAPLDRTFQATRAADIRFVLDAMLDAQASAVPAAVRGRVDAQRVAMMGHSYGGLTTGLVLTQDARVKAGLAVAVPLAGVLEPSAITAITQPTGFLLAVQDNSIRETGNRVIRDNHRRANQPSWLWEVTGAGHWSPTAIAGLTPGLMAGCGEAMTQTQPVTAFAYLDNDIARTIFGSYALAFFEATLGGADAALAQRYMATPRPDEVTVKVSVK
jgi:dienelactone hydrolase